MKFTLGKIPVTVHASFWVMGAIMGLSWLDEPLRIVTWTAIVFASVLIHELGHAVVFRRFGHQPTIELYALGGLTHGTPGVETTPRRDMLVSLAGPAAGFVVGLAVALIDRALGDDVSPTVRRTIDDLLFVNVAWGVFNLLPLYPLDGGQALSGGLRSVWPARGQRAALVISVAVGAITVAGALYFRQTWIAMIAGWCAVTSFQQLGPSSA